MHLKGICIPARKGYILPKHFPRYCANRSFRLQSGNLSMLSACYSYCVTAAQWRPGWKGGAVLVIEWRHKVEALPFLGLLWIMESLAVSMSFCCDRHCISSRTFHISMNCIILGDSLLCYWYCGNKDFKVSKRHASSLHYVVELLLEWWDDV